MSFSAHRCGHRRIGTARHPCAAAAARRPGDRARDLDRPAPADHRLAEAREPSSATSAIPHFARHLQGVDARDPLRLHHQRRRTLAAFRAVNVDGSKNVFRAAASAGVTTIVFVSSITAYGCVPGHPVPIVETTPRVRQADFAYACCKFDVEAFLDEVEPQHPDVAISRIRANVLMGRRMPHLLGDRAADRLDPGPRRRIRCRSSGTRTSPIFWCWRCSAARAGRLQCGGGRAAAVVGACGEDRRDGGAARRACCLPSTRRSTSSLTRLEPASVSPIRHGRRERERR